MRAYRLCAAISRASSRPPFRRRLSLAVGTRRGYACRALSLPPRTGACGGRRVLRDLRRTLISEFSGKWPARGFMSCRAAARSGNSSPRRGSHAGTQRERPRVPRRASGPATVRRLLRLGDLYPGDLIVIERGGGKPRHGRQRSLGRRTGPTTHRSPTRVLESDRPARRGQDAAQPGVAGEDRRTPGATRRRWLRIFASSALRREERRASQSSSDAGLLATGSVLIFPAHRVRVASLPPLPDPIPLPKPQAIPRLEDRVSLFPPPTRRRRRKLKSPPRLRSRTSTQSNQTAARAGGPPRRSKSSD